MFQNLSYTEQHFFFYFTDGKTLFFERTVYIIDILFFITNDLNMLPNFITKLASLMNGLFQVKAKSNLPVILVIE